MKEESPVNPISLYGETKLDAENGIKALSNDEFDPCILRLGTIFGLSPRMRFDLVVNYLTQKALREREISILGGNQWRPFVHVRDVTRAIIRCLESPPSTIKGQIFNVGGDRGNYRLSQLGELIHKLIPQAKINLVSEIKDKRSYRVSFGKIHRILNFNTKFSIQEGILEIIKAIKKKEIKDPLDRKHYNYRV